MNHLKSTAQKLISKVHHRDHSMSPSDQTILVTGASGFVAAHVIKTFLQAGYKVRGTVRSEDTANKVRDKFAQYSNQLSFVIVKDMVAEGAFDEAVKGVHGVRSNDHPPGSDARTSLTIMQVIHTASPFVMSVEDNERDLLEPAIKGTTNILSSISTHAPNVHRVVITSSFAANIDLHKGLNPGYTYTEEDWNPETYEAAKVADGVTAYCASKTFAERAAFDYVEKNHPNFSISTILPPMVYGPVIHPVSSLAGLNTSSGDIWRLMNGSEKEVPGNGFWAFCDVRDVALAHLKAYESQEAANQRFLVAGGNYSYQMVCDAIRATVSDELKDRTPVGKPGSRLEADVYKVDNGKAKRVLGMRFRSLEVSIADAANSLLGLEKTLQ
jgi:nucleoside-diphosphate-sugar epimerase